MTRFEKISLGLNVASALASGLFALLAYFYSVPALQDFRERARLTIGDYQTDTVLSPGAVPDPRTAFVTIRIMNVGHLPARDVVVTTFTDAKVPANMTTEPPTQLDTEGGTPFGRNERVTFFRMKTPIAPNEGLAINISPVPHSVVLRTESGETSTLSLGGGASGTW